MGVTRRLWALTPSDRPVGGVVKILDYVHHALSLDLEVVLASAKGIDTHSPLWRLDAFRTLPEDPRVRLQGDLRIAPEGDDLVLFSWPSHVVDVMTRLPDGFPVDQVIHIVQNTRHANPRFADGWGVRALSRRLTRIMINHQVRDAVAPYLNPHGMTVVVPLGHRADHFRLDRKDGLARPVRVGHTTWKSDVGDRVAALLQDDERFTFRAIREAADWDELRALYHGCDVFLCTPGEEEGFYLPGLEAMAAECLVLTPDVGGNMAYAFFDENCLEVPFEDEAGYVARLEELLAWSDDRVEQFRRAGRTRVEAHSLEQECAGFAEVIERIDAAGGPRVIAPPPVLRPRRADPAFHVLTGVPRSGTTLATHLLNQLPDVVALGEPLRPGQLMRARSPQALLDAIEQFFEEQRTSAIEDGQVISKGVGGRDVDNYVEEARGQLRRDVAAREARALARPVSHDVTIVVKDLSLSTAIVRDLRDRFTVAAMVRNPVAILASWETVDMPFHHGRAPHAEWFNESLARRLLVDDRRERQLRLLDWWFDQYLVHLPRERVLRYEDIVASRGRALSVAVPEAAKLDEDLRLRNENPAYGSVDRGALVDAILARDDAAWWAWYSRDEVEGLRGAIG